MRIKWGVIVSSGQLFKYDYREYQEQSVGGFNFVLNGMELQETAAPVILECAVTTCGHSMDDVHIKWRRSHIGLVQQKPFFFTDTIFENVARDLIGSPWKGSPEDQKRQLVKEACQESFADDFTEELPLLCRQKLGS